MSEDGTHNSSKPRVAARRTAATPPSQPVLFDGRLRSSRAPDVFYDVFADLRTCPPAVSIEQARRLASRSRRRLPQAYWRAPRAIEELLRSRHADSTLLLLGALSSWRCLTNSQAAALVGESALGNPRGELISDLYASGLINLTNPFIGESLGDPSSGATAYQLGSPKRVEELTAGLTWAESLAATGNRLRATASVHGRHDILSAELGIRFAEHLVCGTVLGPIYSQPHALAPRSSSAASASGSADLTLVRGDGLRVAVEVTSNLGQGFKSKVQRWAEILSESWIDDTGLCVLFLVAVPDAARERQGDHVRRETMRIVQAAAARHAGSSRSRTVERIAVATWQEWFPAAHRASPRFAGLTASRPTGTRHSPWKDVDLWNPTALPLNACDSESLRAVIRNSALLGQTHVELRRAFSPLALAADLVRQHAGPLPVVEPQRERSGTRTPGIGQGGVGDPVIPSRLLGPAGTSRVPTKHMLIEPQAARSPWVLAAPEFGHRLWGRGDT